MEGNERQELGVSNVCDRLACFVRSQGEMLVGGGKGDSERGGKIRTGRREGRGKGGEGEHGIVEGNGRRGKEERTRSASDLSMSWNLCREVSF